MQSEFIFKHRLDFIFKFGRTASQTAVKLTTSEAAIVTITASASEERETVSVGETQQ